jgi:acetoacetyl-CoA synthetase
MASSKLGLKPLWLPAPGKPTPMSDYRCHVNRKFDLNLGDSHELHEWSVTRPQEFWTDLYNYLEIVPPLPQEVTKAYDDTLPLSSIPEFFPDTRLNFTENLFSRKRPDATAIISIQEGESIDGERITWRELEKKVALAASALKRNGIKENDRVAALVSNTPLAVIIFLATASMGAIFSSINPDLGAEVGIIQTCPKVKSLMHYVPIFRGSFLD